MTQTTVITAQRFAPLSESYSFSEVEAESVNETGHRALGTGHLFSATHRSISFRIRENPIEFMLIGVHGFRSVQHGENSELSPCVSYIGQFQFLYHAAVVGAREFSTSGRYGT